MLVYISFSFSSLSLHVTYRPILHKVFINMIKTRGGLSSFDKEEMAPRGGPVGALQVSRRYE